MHLLPLGSLPDAMSQLAASPLPMIDPTLVTLREDEPVRKALAILDGVVARIALVLDASGKLMGSVVDGDVRRGLLRGATTDSPVREVMRRDPYVLPISTPARKLLEAMRTLDIRQIPLVSDSGVLAGVVVYDMLAGLRHPERSTPVVIMAGGKGKRLLPITTDIPKPMVPVGGRPMLEWIVQRLAHYGFRNFTLAINYLGHQIEDYFGDGTGFDCHITYLREEQFLGTAGALSLLPERPREPILVMNGDILTSVDFDGLMHFHMQSAASATVCARSHQVEVPYGVLQQEGGWLSGMVEKPVYDNLISAGIYVLSPEAVAHVPIGKVTDMPSVLMSLVAGGSPVAVYAMQDDWLDVGRPDDLDRAKRHFLVQP